MKILFVLFSLDAGGVTSVSDVLADEMIKQGHDVEIISLTEPSSYKNQSFKTTIWHHKSLGLKTFILSFFQLTGFFIKNRNIDAVIIASAYPGIITTLAMKLTLHKAKALVNFHTHISRYAAHESSLKKAILLLGRYILKLADVCANVSRITAKDAQDYFGLKDVKALYNPLPVYLPPDDLETSPPHHWLRNSDIIPIIACSRLSDVKDYPLMFKSLSVLLSYDQRYRLIILGKGQLEQELKQMTHTMNLDDYIDFVGHVSNQRDYMALGKFLWLTSKYEGFNMALLESLSAGTPCVAIDNPPGIHEVLDNGTYGHLIHSRDPEIIAKETHAFAQQSKKEPEFYQRRSDEFLPERITEMYLNCLQGK